MALAALLGPTNTGKTHRAVERMLEHDSGMIGLPLRLLAREIYERLSARVGERAVALVTGEEKRVPERPRYWVCTVEAMPIDRRVDFLAVDEVQLCAHPQRGHSFTERLLHARGERETWFMGSHTAAPLVRELVPTAEIRRHPRLSQLAAVGACGLGSVPPRSAVIAFSAAEVYELADRLRRKRGGAAVVLGSLSPRTRNAQVAMYQAGEVDFLVATDAIGMGLNMDVDHVAFASLRKFDGRRSRALAADELAQIAGRAGRHLRDGTFGAVAPAILAPELARAVESHAFPALRRAVWRNSDLDTSSLAALIGSLRQRPARACLSLIDEADDFSALVALAQKPEVQAAAREPERVRLLWEVCQIPDFRKLMAEHHAALVGEVFAQLALRGELDDDWLDARVRRLEDVSGDIETLLARMELCRTWTYVAHHARWVAHARAWQERTQAAEDELSEALHQRLIERFVERRGRRRAQRALGSQRGEPTPDASVIDGPFAKLLTLRVALAPEPERDDDDRWIEALIEAPHERFRADAHGRILDGEAVLARMLPGTDALRPEVKLDLAERIGGGAQARLARRLVAWTRDLAADALGPLHRWSSGVPNGSELSAAASGLAYQLARSLGTLPCADAREQLRALSPRDRADLAELGVVLGRRWIYLAPALEPRPLAARAALAAAWFGVALELPDETQPSMAPRRGVPEACYLAIGHPLCGGRAVQVAALERALEELEAIGAHGTFALPVALGTTLGLDEDALEGLVIALGFSRSEAGFLAPRRRR